MTLNDISSLAYVFTLFPPHEKQMRGMKTEKGLKLTIRMKAQVRQNHQNLLYLLTKDRKKNLLLP